MRDLAFDIEDCLDQFLPCAACKRGAVSKGELVDFAVRVGKLKKRLESAKQQRTDNGANGSQQAVDQLHGTLAEPAGHVGIEEPKQEVLGLLASEELLVISIVGFGGSGKTQLARAVFDCDEAKDKFGVRAWHTASDHKDGHELLLAILHRLFPQETLLSVPQMQSQVSRLQQRIRFEQKTRCLIVVDDIEKHHWEAIKSFFSELRIIRILLTTSVQTVAKACTKDRGYIYKVEKEAQQQSHDGDVKMADGDDRDKDRGGAEEDQSDKSNHSAKPPSFSAKDKSLNSVGAPSSSVSPMVTLRLGSFEMPTPTSLWAKRVEEELLPSIDEEIPREEKYFPLLRLSHLEVATTISSTNLCTDDDQLGLKQAASTKMCNQVLHQGTCKLQSIMMRRLG
ncbi:hypothetical protein ZWY2020_010601 [Hordeum vulgare]|nr:hypothetical protein ZWY2020_010601 [Hordeum vulgare]